MRVEIERPGPSPSMAQSLAATPTAAGVEHRRRARRADPAPVGERQGGGVRGFAALLAPRRNVVRRAQ
jgi:hypothetical protein